MDRKEFAKYMREARQKAGLSKLRASIEIGYDSDGTINAVEQGRTSIPPYKIFTIARVYNLDIVDFLEKIKNCDPKLYKKYQEFIEEQKKVNLSISYQNLEHESQLDLRLRERNLHNLKQKILRFPHARHKRFTGIYPKGNISHQLVFLAA